MFDITDDERQDLASRVQRGALYLDAHRPGWEYKINIDGLDIRDTEDCLLGQLGIVRFTPHDAVYGFDLDDEFGDDPRDEYFEKRNAAWRYLTLAWQELVGNRVG